MTLKPSLVRESYRKQTARATVPQFQLCLVLAEKVTYSLSFLIGYIEINSQLWLNQPFALTAPLQEKKRMTFPGLFDSGIPQPPLDMNKRKLFPSLPMVPDDRQGWKIDVEHWFFWFSSLVPTHGAISWPTWPRLKMKISSVQLPPVHPDTVCALDRGQNTESCWLIDLCVPDFGPILILVPSRSSSSKDFPLIEANLSNARSLPSTIASLSPTYSIEYRVQILF